MKRDAAHENNWAIAEVIFGIPFLLGIVLHFALPVSLSGISRQVFTLSGIAFTAIGIGIIILARREFTRYGQPTDPGHATHKIVTTGMFAVSRNPLYFGSVLVILGISLLFNVPWMLIMLIVSIIICYHLLIKPEEHYLKEKFGDEYQEYTNSVCRWLGRK